MLLESVLIKKKNHMFIRFFLLLFNARSICVEAIGNLLLIAKLLSIYECNVTINTYKKIYIKWIYIEDIKADRFTKPLL